MAKKTGKTKTDDVLESSLGRSGSTTEETDDGMQQEKERQEEEVIEPTQETPEEPPKETEDQEPDKAPETPEVPAEEPKPKEPDLETLQRENKAVRDEITALRAKNRELQLQQARFQAPPPQTPASPAQPAQVPSARLKIQVGEDGEYYVDPQQVETLVQQRLEEVTRVDPAQQFQYALTEESNRWLAPRSGEEPKEAEERNRAAQEMRMAAEYLQERTQYHAMSTGQKSDSLSGWMDILEVSGIAEEFRSKFPNVPDLWDFVSAFFNDRAPIPDRIRSIRGYMNRYVTSQLREKLATPSPVSSETPGASNVVPIPNKPTPMSKKGTVKPASTPAVAEYQKLSEKAANRTVDMTKPEWDRLRELSEQLEGAA